MQIDTIATHMDSTDSTIQSIIIYSDTKNETTIVYDMIISDTKKVFYFSSEWNNEIYPLNAEMLLKVFNFTDVKLSNLQLLEKERKITKKNPSTNVYYLIETVFNK